MAGNIAAVNRRRCLGGGAVVLGGLLTAACGETQPAESTEDGSMGGIFGFIRQIFGSRAQREPTAAEVAKRLFILKHLIAYVASLPLQEILQKTVKNNSVADELRIRQWQELKDAGLWESVSRKERAYAQTPVNKLTRQQLIDASWRMEAAMVLMWALDMTEEMPYYDTESERSLLQKIPSAFTPEFASSAVLRPRDEIGRARDVAEFWNWRSRTRQLIEDGTEFPNDQKSEALGIRSFDGIVRFSAREGNRRGDLPELINGDFPAMGKAYRDLDDDEWSTVSSIAMERHFALNWLSGYAPNNNWDETPTDT